MQHCVYGLRDKLVHTHIQLMGHTYIHPVIPAWISNYIHYKVWDEISYPFLNFNGATVEV